MYKVLRRLSTLQHHLLGLTPLRSCSTSTPVISVNPSTCLVDEHIRIRVSGLSPNQLVTLTSSVEEGGGRYEARAVYLASNDGAIDNFRDASIAGTFQDVEPMGLFWSLKPASGQGQWLRLVKKDVTSTMHFTINLFNGLHDGNTDIQQTPLSSAVVHRLYMCPSVRRVPVKEGPFRGTIFIPEGEGPFPSLIDSYGGLVSIVETRAALLASHGYAVFALSYLYQDHLAQTVFSTDPQYFKDAVDWFSRQEYVDCDNLGLVGLCYGGCMSLRCAAICPKVKVVVNMSGCPVISASHRKPSEMSMEDVPILESCAKKTWPDPECVYHTDEGIIVNDVYNIEDIMCIPAWRHGAKLLTFVGEDDQQVHPKWQTYFSDHVPARYRDSVTMVRYPGAGHLIEPPYSPLCRVVNPGADRMATVEFLKKEFWGTCYHDNVTVVRYPGAGHLKEPPYSPLCRVVNPGADRMATVEFLKKEFWGEPMVAGGDPQLHAHAQEDSWSRTLDFLQENLKARP